MTREHTQPERPRLAALLAGLTHAPLPEQWRAFDVRAVSDDSRHVTTDGLFVALPGSQADGRKFIPDALQRGARVIVGESLERTGSTDGLFVRVEDARAALGTIAARWYGLEEALRTKLRLVGITGTNGKTTSAHMAQRIFHAAGMRCGMFGTVQYDLCHRSVTARMTTPGTLELFGYLRECVDAGADVVVMEVSSHALDQQRTSGLRFEAAAFTNLSQDHLDYHNTFEAYADAKAGLFAGLDADATAVLNADDSAAARMARDCGAQQLWYAQEQDAALRATVLRDTIDGTHYRLRLPSGTLVLENALPGRHNVYNAQAAAGLAFACGIGVDAIEQGLQSVRNIAGRLQRVPCLQDAEVFVDYAHTPDALENVARVLRPLTRHRLIVVFGAGGDRDRAKRPQMAEAVGRYADLIFATSDNPRTEDPQRILDDIVAGFASAQRGAVHVEADRRVAIAAALAEARAGDVVLIAGKGHECYQIIGQQRLHFDDVEVAIQAAAELAGREQ